uniref:aminotransferase class V-fold PLP-dependent enzyme n=1 Tax=Actinosynnema sp. TaxID=1872144 RepID=UPI003F870895
MTAPADPGPSLRVPADLLPRDGRFGSGPSRVRREQLDGLLAAADVLGTSHRQEPVRALVREVRSSLAALLGAPEGHEVVLGNGGSTAFWDVATGALVGERVQHLVHGEFSAKFAAGTARAPFVSESLHVRAEPGTAARAEALAGVGTYAWAHNETSTGVLAPVARVPGADPDALVLVDATSAAGAVEVDLAATDAYYFAPQKALGSDGGLWCAVLSPAALERAERLEPTRWVPDFLSLRAAVASSRKDETVTTPALVPRVLLRALLRWLLGHGGRAWAAARARESSDVLYAWAAQRDWLCPFVVEADLRSPVVVTLDLVGVDAAAVARVLRDN